MSSKQTPVLVIGGISSGVGKTSIAVGLMAALRERGLTVQAFKIGPDFIDPLHHEVATGRPSINLDGWMMGQEQVLSAFQRHTADADIAVVEGVMGLFDGRDGTTEAGSTAEVAKWLGAPVLLVLDCSAVARSAAAIVKGYQEFDPALCLAALLFNKVGGAAHTKWLSDAIASAGLGVKVLGGIPKDDAVAIQERYLGLHLPQDRSMPPGLIANLATLVRNHVDLDAVIKLASTAHTTLPTASTELDGAPSDGSTEAHLAKVAPTVGGLRISDTANTEGDGAAEEAPRPQSGGLASAGSGGGGKKKRKKAKRQASQPQEQAAQLAAAPSSTTAGSTGPAAIDGITAPSEAEVGPNEQSTASLPLPSPPVRIAVARDAAFCFYYFDNLTLLAEAGAEIVLFSPLHDPLPPDIAAVYLGGGYPEHHAAELAENKLFRAELKAFADAGGVVYAECGGLLVLSQSLQPRGEPAQPMVGVFPFKAVLPPGKYTMGYVEIETTAECPLFPPGVKARGHVHHASELVEEHHVGGVVAADAAPHGGTNGHVGAAWRTGYLIRPQVPGAPESPEGFSCHNVLASYVHLHFGGCPGLAKALVERSRQVDVAAVNEAVAAAASTAPMLEGACAQATPPSSSAMFNPGPPPGMIAVRSSPDFNRLGGNPRSRSVDLSRHHGFALLPGSKMLSPATTLSKVVSSGSLSTQSAQYHLGGVQYHGAHGDHFHAPSMHHHHMAGVGGHGERASQRSESPLLLSPRAGSDISGFAAAGHAELDPYGAYPPGHMHTNPLAGGGAANGQHYLRSGQYPPGYIPTGPGSEDGYMNRSASWTHLNQHHPPHLVPVPPHSGANGGAPMSQQWQSQHPAPAASLPAGGLNGIFLPSPSVPEDTVVAATPDPEKAPSRGPRLLPGSLDLSTLNRHDSPLLQTASSECATPHNWQHGFRPSDKVVTLGPGATEVAWALGLGNRVVAVSDTCDYPPEAASKAKAARRLPPASTSATSSVPASTTHSPTKLPGGSSGSMSGGGSSTSSGVNLAALAAATAAAAAAAAREAPLSTLPCRIDEQVLARERPGLIIYEEDEAPFSCPGNAAASSSAVGSIGRTVAEAVASVGLKQACRVVCLHRSTLSDVFSSMLAVGEAAGVGDEAVRAVDRLRNRLRRVAGEAARAAAASAPTPRPRCLVLRSLQPLVAAGLWTPDMVMLAGGEPGSMQPGDPQRVLSWAEVVAFAPDVLIIAGLVDGNGVQTFKDLCAAASLPGWWALPAVKAGAVYVCEDVLLLRAGPRLIEGTESLARMMHGDAVSVCCPPRAVLKLSLRPGQRCRPRLLPSYFVAYC